MSDFWRTALILLAAVNPAAVGLAARDLLPAERRLIALVGSAVALGAFLLATFAADPFLDLLDIAPETFRLAAAIVLAAVGMFAVWRGRVAAAPGDGWQAGIFPAGIPLLAGPAGLAAALSLSADNGAGVSFAAAIAPVLLGGAAIAWLPGRSGAAADGLARLLGALLVVLAAAMAVDGVRSV